MSISIGTLQENEYSNRAESFGIDS